MNESSDVIVYNPCRLAKKVFSIHQLVDLVDLSNPITQANAAGGDFFYATSFKLNDLDQVSSFTALYDQYRITKIVCRVRPIMNALQGISPATAYWGGIYVLVDFDDAVLPASLAVMREYETCRQFSSVEKFDVVIEKPHIALAAYSGAFASFANISGQWVDSASPTVQHYGIKFGVPHGQAAQTLLQSWTVTAEYFCQFRNTK